ERKCPRDMIPPRRDYPRIPGRSSEGGRARRGSDPEHTIIRAPGFAPPRPSRRGARHEPKLRPTALPCVQTWEEQSVRDPLVSVVIPFFNPGRFLMEALDSVSFQTYDNWELYLVDDGSTDGSSELARQFATAHAERVHYVEHPGHANLGQAASRNV